MLHRSLVGMNFLEIQWYIILKRLTRVISLHMRVDISYFGNYEKNTRSCYCLCSILLFAISPRVVVAGSS